MERFSFSSGVGNNNDGTLVLGATNIPWVLDAAIRRRWVIGLHAWVSLAWQKPSNHTLCK